MTEIHFEIFLQIQTILWYDGIDYGIVLADMSNQFIKWFLAKGSILYKS